MGGASGLTLTTETWTVAALLGFFLFLQLLHPKLPGMLHEGTLMDQFLASEILQVLEKNSFWELLVQGRLPVQREQQSYHGTLMAYLYIPFLQIFGRSWMAAKYWPTFFGLVTMIFTWRFVRNLFDPRVGLLTLALLIIHPTFVMGTRIGGPWLNHMQMFSMGSLYFLERWWSTRKGLFLGLGALFVGLGLCTQLWFYWFVVGLVIACLVFRKELVTDLGLKESKNWLRWLAWGGGGFAVGLSLVIYRELFYRLDSMDLALGMALSPDHPYSIFHYFSRFPEVMTRVGEFLSGEHAFEFIFPFDEAKLVGRPSNIFYPVLVGLSAIFLLTSHAHAWKGKRAALPPLILITMVLLSPIASHLPNIHLFFLYPLPAIVLGLASVVLYDMAAGGRWRKIALAACLATLGAKDVAGLVTHYSQLRTTGGAREFSDTIYDLADWLRNHREPAPSIFFLWDAKEFERHLYFILPEMDLDFRRLEGFTTETMLADFEKKLRAVPAERPVLFVRHFFGVLRQEFDPLLEWSERNGFAFRHEATFSDEDGVAVFEVYGIERE